MKNKYSLNLKNEYKDGKMITEISKKLITIDIIKKLIINRTL
ncbi:hypothetical protein J2Z53_000375 [Clostridium moniliforme]|uniref:Transposase n=1 Tax=Clostridium moniliforme TaxID=39489 RepID=A0ABS4EXT7_9CLOT|nr:hypothetical protein [Clostridium moniliforme]MBP1888796.1 hypothetical protein [Clostridium moniliforme]